MTDEQKGLQLQLVRHLAEQRALFSKLMHSVGTIDSVIYEHDTQQLPTQQNYFTMSLQPQTSQTEFIRGIFVSITVPTQVAGPVITLNNAWAKLGDEYINLNALLVSVNGTGGMMPGSFTFVLSSESTRQVTVVSPSDWPSGAYLTFALFGEAVPTMDGGVLH